MMTLTLVINNFTLFNLKQAQIGWKGNRIKAHFLEEWYADKYVFIDKLDRRNCFLFKDTGHSSKSSS